MYTVPDKSATTLLPIICDNILTVTTMMSDRWHAYHNLGQLPGLFHQTVKHSVNFVDLNTGAHTQKIERSWKTAKERKKRHNGTRHSMLDSYMCKFCSPLQPVVRPKCPLIKALAVDRALVFENLRPSTVL